MKIQPITCAAVWMFIAISASGCVADKVAAPSAPGAMDGDSVGLIVSTAWERGLDVHAVRFLLETVPCADEDDFEPDRVEATVPVKREGVPFAHVVRAEVSFDLPAGCFAASSELLGEHDKALPGCPRDEVVIELVTPADREQGGEAPHRHIQFHVTCVAEEMDGKAARASLR